MKKQQDQEDLLNNLKRVSPSYDLTDDETRSDPNTRVNLILQQLDKLKQTSLDPTFNAHRDLDDEILKEVYDTSVSQLFRKPENSETHHIFDRFNFDFVIAQPRDSNCVAKR